jgi:hypothetical protein
MAQTAKEGGEIQQRRAARARFVEAGDFHLVLGVFFPGVFVIS